MEQAAATLQTNDEEKKTEQAPVMAVETIVAEEEEEEEEDHKPAPTLKSGSNISTANKMNGSKPPPPSSGNQSSSTGGLSELSKQLRILQATNEAQGVEIARLERQLKILSDLHGVSVGNLRQALEEACQAEAFAELQNQVSILEAKLQAKQLATGGGENVQQHPDIEASRRKIANLELRIGELEEVEEKQKDEIKSLYEELREKTFTQAAASSSDQTPPTPAPTPTAAKEALAEPAAHSEPSEGSLPAEPVPPPTTQATTTETRPAATQEEAAATVSDPAFFDPFASALIIQRQLEAAEEQHRLRQAQFKARFMVQDERIQDLEGQVSSLYTAFGLVQQERSDEEKEIHALQDNLQTADAQVAQQVNEQEKQGSSPTAVAELLPPAFSPPPSTPNHRTTTTTTTREIIPPAAAALSPSAHLYTKYKHKSPPYVRSSSSSRAYKQTGMARPITSPVSPPRSHTQQTVLEGILLQRISEPFRKKWKPRHAVLTRLFTHYELALYMPADGDGGGGGVDLNTPPRASPSVTTKIYQIFVGLSRVTAYTKKPNSFILHVSPKDITAPILYASATTPESYQEWMTVLAEATRGPGDEQGGDIVESAGSESLNFSASISHDELDMVEQQQMADLEQALERSKREV